MTRAELIELRRNFFLQKQPYQLMHWSAFDFTKLNKILWLKKTGKGGNQTYNDCFIMLDTETSKKRPDEVYENHIVAWTISIRAFDINIVTLYGHKPSTCIECIEAIIESMQGELTYFYVHNLSYDWVFLRKFMLRTWNNPIKQLNTKPHYPVFIQFENGVILRDSLILAQRSLDKWSKDLNVEHQKACGKWDYDLLRNQDYEFNDDELEYIEHDTLAGVECLDATAKILNKKIHSMPWTATGIPREEVRNRGKEYHAHDAFKKQALTYEQQQIALNVYHGGYTHGNRNIADYTITKNVKCYDFASSYPFVMLSEKYPSEKFIKLDDCRIQDILDDIDNAYIFKLVMVRPELKEYWYPMPALQFSKCVKVINPILDNGRILTADYVEIYITEIDLAVIDSQYKYEKHICTEVYAAAKRYLPKWFTNYIFELFNDKTKLKNGDPVAYAMAKAKLNSLYGMCVQKPVKDDIVEDYDTGDYTVNSVDYVEEYNKYVDRYTTVLPYQWGVWVTAYAFRNLFELGKCAGTWIYSDTDSCYGFDWDDKAIEKYNKSCKKKLKDNGYGGVKFNGREYWLGVAEFDGEYNEFRVIGSKRYCGRSIEDGQLHITVAGVPKKGASCLKDDINNFTKGLIFSGEVTGKKTHTYFYVDDIYVDKNGNETGDSIDLSPCDYLLNNLEQNPDWLHLITNEIEVNYYDENEF